MPNEIQSSAPTAVSVPGSPPTPSSHRGCPFSGRCGYALSLCKRVCPALEERDPGRHVVCHLSNPIDLDTLRAFC